MATSKKSTSSSTKKKTTSSSTKSKSTSSSSKKKSSSSTSKAVNKQVKKFAKKYPVLAAVIAIAIVVVVCILYFGGYIQFAPSNQNNNSNKTSVEPIVVSEGTVYDDFQMHFMQLGNGAAGDSIYIKAGDTDVLIDAGSSTGSAPTLKAYIDNYCTDGKLEYVIATHGDEDHIAAFTGTNGIFASYDIDVLIDFPYSTKTTKLYENYCNQRVKATTHYYASQCFNETDGAKRTYQLSENVTMDILYNYYYFNEQVAPDTPSSKIVENNYSVCTMFNYGDHHFLFTGDLEEIGEERMAAYYDKSTPEKTLPNVDLFKAGHHGSGTSSNEALLDLVNPQICVVQCCAGTAEYSTSLAKQFPTQEFINRISKYTDSVYVTSMITETSPGFYEYGPMNGDIIVSCGKNASNVVDVALAATNNLTKLKDTTWFNETVYVDAKGNNIATKGKTVGEMAFYSATTEGCSATTRRTWPN